MAEKSAKKTAQTKHRPDPTRPDPIQIKAIVRPLEDERYQVAICRLKPLEQRFQNHGGLHRALMEALKNGDPSAPEDLFPLC